MYLVPNTNTIDRSWDNYCVISTKLQSRASNCLSGLNNRRRALTDALIAFDTAVVLE